MKILPAIAVLLSTVALACDKDSNHAPSATVAGAKRDTAMIDSVPKCSACSLTIVDSVRLGTPEDKFIPVRPPGMLRDSQGHYYLTFNNWSGQPILQYDSTGHFVRRVGNDGQGPGEYRMTSAVLLDPFDSLYVFEAGGRIGQIFSAGGQYIRRNDIHGAMPFAATTSSARRILATQLQPWPPNSRPLHVFSYTASGAATDSFPVFSFATGAKGRTSQGKESYPYEAVVHSSPYATPDGSVWTIAGTNYRLEKHDTSGAVRKRFGVRVAGESPPVLRIEDVASARPSGTFIPTLALVRSANTKRVLHLRNWIDVDSTGLLWVSRHTAAPSWDTISSNKMYSSREAPSEELLPRDIEDRLYHTVIEIIDPNAGTMLTRLELPFKAERVRAGFIGRTTANEEGYYLPSVYRLQLKLP